MLFIEACSDCSARSRAFIFNLVLLVTNDCGAYKCDDINRYSKCDPTCFEYFFCKSNAYDVFSIFAHIF